MQNCENCGVDSKIISATITALLIVTSRMGTNAKAFFYYTDKRLELLRALKKAKWINYRPSYSREKKLAVGLGVKTKEILGENIENLKSFADSSDKSNHKLLRMILEGILTELQP